jgi:hypothetical protein
MRKFLIDTLNELGITWHLGQPEMSTENYNLLMLCTLLLSLILLLAAVLSFNVFSCSSPPLVQQQRALILNVALKIVKNQ